MKHTLRVVILLGLLAGCGGDTEEVGRADRPARPSLADDGTDTGELVFRLADFGFADPTQRPDVGRDLDGFDTSLASPLAGQCASPSGAVPPLDGPGGVDNVFYTQVGPIVDLVVPCLQDELQSEQLLGRGTLILHIEGWNGEASDSAVVASLVVAADGTSADFDEVAWDATTHQLVLASDGTTPAADPQGQPDDAYIVRPDSVDGSGTPRLRDTNAYLSDGTLVFAIPERGAVPLRARTTSLQVQMTDGLLLAQLSEDFASITTGSLSGRYGLADFLNQAGSIGICEPQQSLVEQQLRGSLDVRTDATAAPGGECDAMSFGFPFTGVPTTLATLDGKVTLAGSNPPLANACEYLAGEVCQ